MKELAIIAGSSNQKLAYDVCRILDIQPTPVTTTKFGNGECHVEINADVRNKDVFVLQSSSDTTNDHLMELLFLLDALRRSSCFRITAVMPCFPYARGDRKMKSRTPIAAKLVANIIQTAGVNRFLTMELHAPQIAGFFDIPVDNLHLSKTFLPFIQKRYNNTTLSIVAPDAGSVKIAKSYAGKLNCDVAMIYKNRIAPGQIGEMKIIGNVDNKSCIIIDDIFDTGGTICKATKLLMENGAKCVEAFCTHAVLSGPAIQNLHTSTLSKLFVTDTIDNDLVRESNKIEVLSAAPLLAEAIFGINHELSLAYLFDN